MGPNPGTHIKTQVQAGDTAHGGEALATKPDNPSSMPRTPQWKDRLSSVLCPPHVCGSAHHTQVA